MIKKIKFIFRLLNLYLNEIISETCRETEESNKCAKYLLRLS